MHVYYCMFFKLGKGPCLFDYHDASKIFHSFLQRVEMNRIAKPRTQTFSSLLNILIPFSSIYSSKKARHLDKLFLRPRQKL